VQQERLSSADPHPAPALFANVGCAGTSAVCAARPLYARAVAGGLPLVVQWARLVPVGGLLGSFCLQGFDHLGHCVSGGTMG